MKFLKVAGSALFTLALFWFVVDRSMFSKIYESMWYWIGGYGALIAIFLWLSWRDGKRITIANLKDIFIGSAVLVFAFAFITGGRGCSSVGESFDGCRPAGPGIYNDC